MSNAKSNYHLFVSSAVARCVQDLLEDPHVLSDVNRLFSVMNFLFGIRVKSGSLVHQLHISFFKFKFI